MSTPPTCSFGNTLRDKSIFVTVDGNGVATTIQPNENLVIACPTSLLVARVGDAAQGPEFRLTSGFSDNGSMVLPPYTLTRGRVASNGSVQFKVTAAKSDGGSTLPQPVKGAVTLDVFNLTPGDVTVTRTVQVQPLVPNSVEDNPKNEYDLPNQGDSVRLSIDPDTVLTFALPEDNVHAQVLGKDLAAIPVDGSLSLLASKDAMVQARNQGTGVFIVDVGRGFPVLVKNTTNGTAGLAFNALTGDKIAIGKKEQYAVFVPPETKGISWRVPTANAQNTVIVVTKVPEFTAQPTAFAENNVLTASMDSATGQRVVVITPAPNIPWPWWKWAAVIGGGILGLVVVILIIVGIAKAVQSSRKHHHKPDHT